MRFDYFIVLFIDRVAWLTTYIPQIQFRPTLFYRVAIYQILTSVRLYFPINFIL
jgi:hypothetical protein